VTFHLKSDPQGNLQYGLIAEEVAKVYPELVIRDETGRIDGVRYDELAPLLLNEVQQQLKIAAQEEQDAVQTAEIRELTQRQKQFDIQGMRLRDDNGSLHECKVRSPNWTGSEVVTRRRGDLGITVKPGNVV
jgi:hypothetical protein